VQRTARDLVRGWIIGDPDLQRQGMTWRVAREPSASDSTEHAI